MRKKLPRNPTLAGLDLAPAMAVLVIVLVLPLDAFSLEDDAVKPSADLVVPAPVLGLRAVPVSVVVTRREILVDGVPVIDLERSVEPDGAQIVQIPASAMDGPVVTKLLAVLDGKARAARAEDPASSVQMLLQSERGVPLGLVGQVVYTAGQAGLGGLRFVEIEGGP